MLSEERLSLLRQMAHGLAVQFGPACEVVIHDLTDGPEHTVVHIENGHVSGRSLGSGPSHVVFFGYWRLCWLFKALKGKHTPSIW